MIGSHDTFTYLPPSNPLFRLFSRWWRTQSKTIDFQHNRGIRFFDIRVCMDKYGRWQLCHGVVNLLTDFYSLASLCYHIQSVYPDTLFRLVLEKGDKYVQKVFTQEASPLCEEFPNLWRVDIKSTGNWMGAVANNNQALYDKGYKFALGNTWDKPAQELHGFVTKKNWWKINLKREAKRINSNLFNTDNEWEEALKDKEHLYFLDYIETIKPKTQA